MLRPYENGPSDEVTAFVGREVERTPAYGTTTLFVVGRPPIGTVGMLVDAAQEVQTKRGMAQLTHIFFGANWSFDGENVGKWADLIRYFLKEGFWCTLDFRPNQIPLIQKSGLIKHARFIPLIGVRVPSAYALGNNATLKIDDIRFAGTNKGVWCMNMRDLLSRNECLTEWSAYGQDIPIKADKE